MMVCHAEVKVVAPNNEPNLYEAAQRVQTSFKFRNFYDHMDFGPEHRLAPHYKGLL